MPKPFQQMKKKRLRLAFFVTFEFGGELSESAQGLFERGHSGSGPATFPEAEWQSKVLPTRPEAI